MNMQDLNDIENLDKLNVREMNAETLNAVKELSKSTHLSGVVAAELLKRRENEIKSDKNLTNIECVLELIGLKGKFEVVKLKLPGGCLIEIIIHREFNAGIVIGPDSFEKTPNGYLFKLLCGCDKCLGREDLQEMLLKVCEEKNLETIIINQRVKFAGASISELVSRGFYTYPMYKPIYSRCNELQEYFQDLFAAFKCGDQRISFDG
jgi:hypothetical protein